MSSDTNWRGIIAALSNPAAREVFAEVVLGVDGLPALERLSPSRRRRVVDVLITSGLVRHGAGGRLVETPDVFANALAADPAPPRPSGVDRFFDGGGRLTGYPTRPAVRASLLEKIAREIVEPGEVLDEKTLNSRLAAVADDVALLRRHLVDHGLLERTRSGSEYARPAEGDGASPPHMRED